MHRCSSVVILGLLGLAACSASPGADESSEEKTERAQQAISTCTVDDLGSGTSAAACSGPWRYHRWVAPCYASAATEACGTRVVPNGCERDATCNHITGHTTATLEVRVQGVAKQHRECESGRGELGFPVNRPYCYNVTTYDVPAACRAQAERERATRQGRSATGTVVSSDERWGQCRIVVSEVPQWRVGPSPTCGRERYACPKPLTCRSPRHGLDPNHKACGVDGIELTSGLGLTLAELTELEGTKLVTGASADQNPYCTTENNLPVQGRASVRFDAVMKLYRETSSRLAAGENAPDGPATLSVAARELKLLGELFGAELTKEQRAALFDEVVTQTPEAQNTCGTTWEAPASGDGCQVGAELRGELVFCKRLLEGHAPSSSAAAFMDRCVESYEAVSTALSDGTSAGACPDAYATEAHDVTLSVLEKGLQSRILETGSTRVQRLRERLATMSRWFDVRRAGREAAPTEEELGDASRVVRAFWEGVYARDFSVLDEQAKLDEDNRNPTLIAAELDKLASGEFALERAVLEALYGSSGPEVKANAIAALVTMDALSPIVERLRAVSRFRDLACVLSRCSASESDIPRDLERAWSLLGAMPDGTKLAVELSRPLGNMRLATALATLQANRALFEAGVADLAGRPYASSILTDEPLSGPLSGLAAVVREANEKSRQRMVTGRLGRIPEPHLLIGLQGEKRSETRLLAENRLELMASVVTEYEANRGSKLGELLAQNQANNATRAVETRLTSALVRYDQLSVALGALRDAYGAEELAFGDFGVALRESANSDPGSYQVIANGVSSVSASASGASNWHALGEIAVKQGASLLRMRLKAGDVASLSVSGQWSPTCALRDVRMPGTASSLSSSGAITGSEGFAVHRSSLAYVVAAVNARSKSNSTCTTSAQAAGAGAINSILSESRRFGQEAQDCLHSDTSIMASRSSSSGGSDTETRWSATFAAGVRTPSAPYPDLPAGALLAVTMPPNDTQRGHELDVRVVTSRTAIVVSHDADVYFVVNDVAGCADASGALSLDYALLAPNPAMATVVAPAVTFALEGVRTQRNQGLEQGALLWTSEEELRAKALADIEARLPGGDLSQLPSLYRSFIATWLDHELAQLRRAVDIQSLENQRDAATLELAQLTHDVASAHEHSRMVGLSRRWAVESFESDQLAPALELVQEATMGVALPLALIRYPEALASLRADPMVMQRARQMLNASLTTPLTTLARDADYLVRALLDAIDTAPAVQPTGAQTTSDVAVSFPNPAMPSAATSPYWKADAATSAALWEGIRSEGRFALSITPELLYRRTLGVASLSCNQAAPVITGMAAYVVMGQLLEETQGMNQVPWSIPWQVGDRMKFPTASGTKVLTFANRDWLSGTGLRVLFGPPDQAGFVFSQNFESVQGYAGLSPFARMEMSFEALVSAYGQRVLSAPEIILYFRLQGQPIPAPGLEDVMTCR